MKLRQRKNNNLQTPYLPYNFICMSSLRSRRGNRSIRNPVDVDTSLTATAAKRHVSLCLCKLHSTKIFMSMNIREVIRFRRQSDDKWT